MERHHGSSLAHVKPISLLTELPGLLGCGFYKYGAPDGARNCTWAGLQGYPGLEEGFRPSHAGTGQNAHYH